MSLRKRLLQEIYEDLKCLVVALEKKIEEKETKEKKKEKEERKKKWKQNEC